MIQTVLSLSLSTEKKHWLRFTWHKTIGHGVRILVRCLYSVIINSFMFSPFLLSCFLCFNKTKTITMWGGFSLQLLRETTYSFSMHYKMIYCFFGFFFLLSWSTFTIGIEQLCTDRNNKFPKMVYNPVISVSLKGVWWNGQTLENGLKLNKLKRELDSWINILPLRHRITEERLIGSQTRTFCFLHGVNPIMVTISIC